MFTDEKRIHINRFITLSMGCDITGITDRFFDLFQAGCLKNRGKSTSAVGRNLLRLNSKLSAVYHRNTTFGRNGFILEQFLIGMFVVTACIPITLVCLEILSKELRPDPRIQDAVAITQLRRILVVADEIEVSPQELRFLYHEEKCSVSLINRNLIMKPGTQLILTDLDNVTFKNNDVVLLSYSRGNTYYEATIASIP